ncbi:hypothetical protein PENSPDRAFT_571345 [Peniophora sp. CONT]|nr:hypothetical protein PENSPDRAFT_571345 [Peniophora sp. CONT]
MARTVHGLSSDAHHHPSAQELASLVASAVQHSPAPDGSPTPPLDPQDQNASIQSILAAARDLPQASSTPPHWPANTSSKRKLDDADAEDPHPKIRRVVREHVVQPNAPMTTIVCLHAAVAQKSYGSEKRFLCPPPVVHVEGPGWQMRQQKLSMSVVSETGERSFGQNSTLDAQMSASFKFLHVTGTAKAKSFLLSLDIAEPPAIPAAVHSDDPPQPFGRVWASFDSAPVTIISKPSKKTAKTRNISSCILAGGPVSLFNRINSQTVRTKYMTIDNNQLCASNVSWSAFSVNVMRRSQEVPNVNPQPVTYGSEVVLTDTLSGISTAPLVIRKVDKGRIASDDGGPVSQMQKIALQRVNADGSRHYLSAAGPMPGGGAPTTPQPPPGQAGTHPLIFQSPRVRDEVKDGVRTVTDEVDDYLCWTIVGISKFQYTFFDAFGPSNNVPDMSITPFPTLFTSPVYRPPTNSLELTVSNFFYDDPTTQQRLPLDIYLGGIGPLRARVYEAAPPGPLTSISPFVPSEGGNEAGVVSNRFLHSPLHTIVVVELPTLAEVVAALAESPAPDADDPPKEGEASAPAPVVNGNPQPSDVAGRTLPLLFIRSSDGVGYHSGRTITVENVFQGIDLMAGAPGNENGEWLGADGQMHAAGTLGSYAWSLRVL